MPDTSLEYRDKFLRQKQGFDRKYRELLNKVADDIAIIANDPNARFSKSFVFKGAAKKRIDIAIDEFYNDALLLTENEIKQTWAIANAKNDEIVKDYIKTLTGIKAAQKAEMFLTNTTALNAFISDKRGTAALSDAIWEVASQLRGEMQIHLGLGILNGDSASVISRRIRRYLKEPESYFRRVRDVKGNLVASRAMIANAPGRGKYNSAFKNAMRVARTSTNRAYLAADNLRWQELTMVIGVKIVISEQHKIYDICDECQGTYPKDFVFTGWHPSCLCHATPILMSKEEFDAYLKGDQPLKADQITDMPQNFEKYIKENYDRYAGYKEMPYFIQDNKEIINKIIK
jgi:hypothetical protein